MAAERREGRGQKAAGLTACSVTPRPHTQSQSGKVETGVLTTAVTITHVFLNNVLPRKNKIAPGRSAFPQSNGSDEGEI